MNGFVKYNRSEQSKRLHARPNENHVLSVIAYRISREGNPVKGVQVGECIISDYDNFGLKRQPMRTAIANLRKWGYITTRATNKTTYAKLVNTEVYDCNLNEANQQNNQQLTNKNTNEQPPKQPTANHYQEVKNKEVKNNTTTSTEFTPTPLDPNGLTNQEISEHLDDIYKTPADIARMVKLSLGHEISDEKATELLESFLTKGLSEYYTHIKSKALILGKFQQWCKNGVEKFNKPKEKTESQKNDISITDHYKKYYPDKWKFLANSGKLKEYEAKFTDLKFKYSNIAKSHKNPTITAAFIFEAVQTHLNRHLSGSNEERRIASLTKWIERDLSDYKRNKADVRDEFYQWTQNKDK